MSINHKDLEQAVELSAEALRLDELLKALESPLAYKAEIRVHGTPNNSAWLTPVVASLSREHFQALIPVIRHQLEQVRGQIDLLVAKMAQDTRKIDPRLHPTLSPTPRL